VQHAPHAAIANVAAPVRPGRSAWPECVAGPERPWIVM
jgi:hypothetical protein